MSPKVEALLHQIYDQVHEALEAKGLNPEQVLAEDFEFVSADDIIEKSIEEATNTLTEEEFEELATVCEGIAQHYENNWWKEGWPAPEEITGWNESN